MGLAGGELGQCCRRGETGWQRSGIGSLRGEFHGENIILTIAELQGKSLDFSMSSISLSGVRDLGAHIRGKSRRKNKFNVGPISIDKSLGLC
jgi:hypothetical protein